MSTRAVSGPSEAFVAELYDSQTKTFLVDPQSVNCTQGHTFSRETVYKLFGKVSNNGLCERFEPCPLCQEIVRTYEPNLQVQRIVAAYVGAIGPAGSKPVYPLAATNMDLHERYKDDKGVRRTGHSSQFCVIDVCPVANPFGEPIEDRARVHSVTFAINGSKKPEISVDIQVHANKASEPRLLLEFYHASGVTKKLVQLEHNRHIGTGHFPMTVAEFKYFIIVLLATNNCTDYVHDLLESEVRRCETLIAEQAK